MMTKEERDEARKRVDAAEDGPWSVVPSKKSDRTCSIYSPGECLFIEKIWHTDANFIAHARTDLPQALDALDEKDKEIEGLRGALGNLLLWSTDDDGAYEHAKQVLGLGGDQ